MRILGCDYDILLTGALVRRASAEAVDASPLSAPAYVSVKDNVVQRSSFGHPTIEIVSFFNSLRSVFMLDHVMLLVMGCRGVQPNNRAELGLKGTDVRCELLRCP